MNDFKDILCSETGNIRQGAGVIVFNVELTHVYMSQRIGGSFDGLWQCPGGKLEPGEAPNAGAARELKEEAGLPRLFLPNRNFITTLGKNPHGHYLFHWFFTVLGFEEELRHVEPKQNSTWYPFRVDSLKGIPMMPNLHKMTFVAHEILRQKINIA